MTEEEKKAGIKEQLKAVQQRYNHITEATTLSELYDYISAWLDCYSKARNIINSVSNNELRLVLKLRYIHFLEWKQISTMLGHVERHIYFLHNRALQAVQCD